MIITLFRPRIRSKTSFGGVYIQLHGDCILCSGEANVCAVQGRVQNVVSYETTSDGFSPPHRKCILSHSYVFILSHSYVFVLSHS